MIKFNELSNYTDDNEILKQLNNHLNNMAKKTIIFVANLVNDEDESESVQKKNQELRKKLVAPMVKQDSDKKKTIISILNKIYSNEYEEFTGEEKYTLARVIDYAIKIEENAMYKLLEEDKDKALKWLEIYKINDNRSGILKTLKRKGDKTKLIEAKNVINKESSKYQDFINKNTNKYLFFVEYPTALNLIFDHKEYNLIIDLQPEKL